MESQLEFDEIGYWSEIKLEILKEYASAYSKILAAQKNPALEHVYIDAFAGAGMHVTKLTKNFVPGSARQPIECFIGPTTISRIPSHRHSSREGRKFARPYTDTEKHIDLPR